MIKWIVRKYLLGKLNDVLDSLKDNEKVNLYRGKILQITKFLSNIQEYLKDNRIDEDEIEKISKELEELI